MRVLNIPTAPDEWRGAAKLVNIKWQFPNVVGALDGKHVAKEGRILILKLQGVPLHRPYDVGRR